MSSYPGREGLRAYGLAIEEEMLQRREDLLHVEELERRERESAAEVREEIPTSTDQSNHNDEWANNSGYSGSWDNRETTSDSTYMTNFDRALYYAMYIQHFGLSDEEIKRMEDLMTVLYGIPPPILYRTHVELLYKDMLKDLNRQRYYFCCSCNEGMSDSQAACQSSGCSIRGLNIKRAKRMQRIEVHVVNFIPQLSDILVRDVEKIIQMHGYLHENREAHNEDRSDIRLFDGYYQNIESPEAYNRKHLKVLLSMSIDGFRPRRLSKREIWPLYLRVEGLPPCEANSYYNSIITGAIFGRVKPSEKVMETLLTRIESELHDLHDSPIEIGVGESVWTLEVQLYRGVADLAAQQALYGVPRWNSEYGCSKCYIKGTRIGNRRVWIAGSDADTMLRDRDSYSAAEIGQYGIPKLTSAMRLMLPIDFPGDALHICSEGITKDRLRDLFNADSKYPDLKVKREDVEKIKSCLLGISCHTYSNSLILSLEDVPTCKATELDELAFAVFPLAAAVGVIPSPIAAAGLVGYWLCLKIISRSLTLTVPLIEKAKLLAKLTREVWIVTAADIYTMKCHWFFDHAMEEEIASYGTTYQWSSCPFESHHRRLQIRVNQSTTNSSSVIIEKYLLSKRVKALFSERCTNTIAPLLALKDKVENRHKKRFPVDIRISDSTYIPKNSRICPSDLNAAERSRISRSGEEAYSRLVVQKKVYSSRIYWKRAKSSRQDLIHLEEDEGIDCFGSIIVFLYNRRNNSVRVLIDEYKSCDPFEHLHNLVNHIPNECRRIALNLMRTIRENNCYFRELTGTVSRVKSSSAIRGPCSLLKYGSHTYVLRT